MENIPEFKINSKKSTNFKLWLGISLGLILGCVIAIIAQKKNKPINEKQLIKKIEKTESQNEFDLAWSAVQDNLKSPSTSSWVKWNDYIDEKFSAHLFHIQFDSQNSFGALIRSHALVYIYKSKDTGKFMVGKQIDIFSSDEWPDNQIGKNINMNLNIGYNHQYHESNLIRLNSKN